MQITKYLFGLLFLSIFITACGGDDTVVDPDPEKTCSLITVWDVQDATTSIGLFDVIYDESGRIATAGLQEYDFTYDADGNITSALLPDGDFNPQVEVVFTYVDGKITTIVEKWGVDIIEDRYTYQVFYDDNNHVNLMSRTGLGGPSDLVYDFDSNGNVLIWTDPTFEDIQEYTYGTEKGIMRGLTHNQAFAMGIAISRPHFHFNNNIMTEKLIDSDGTISSSSTFSDITYTVDGFQATATDSENKSYRFEYECE